VGLCHRPASWNWLRTATRPAPYVHGWLAGLPEHHRRRGQVPPAGRFLRHLLPRHGLQPRLLRPPRPHYPDARDPVLLPVTDPAARPIPIQSSFGTSRQAMYCRVRISDSQSTLGWRSCQSTLGWRSSGLAHQSSRTRRSLAFQPFGVLRTAIRSSPAPRKTGIDL
jgi:hypothetical protein